MWRHYHVTKVFQKTRSTRQLKVINMEYKVPLFSIAWTRQLIWDVAAYECFLWAEASLLSVPTNERLPIQNHYKIFWRRDVIASAICRAISYWNAARRSRESVSSVYRPPLYRAIDITARSAKTLFYQLWKEKTFTMQKHSRSPAVTLPNMSCVLRIVISVLLELAIYSKHTHTKHILHLTQNRQ